MKQVENNKVTLNGVEYVRVDSISTDKNAKKLNGMKYVICRTQSAGVFAGYLESKKGQEVVLREVRRLWYWSGAASLSQVAVEGVKKPDECKFPITVNRIELTQAIEILDCTEEAKLIIMAVPVWKQ